MSVIAAPDVGAQEDEVARLRAELGQVELQAQQAVQAAQGRLSEAQGRLDGQRVELIREAAARWRLRAVELREEAVRCGDETIVVTQHVSTPGLGDRRVPELRYRSDEFEAEAAQADATAALCETWLLWFDSDEPVDSEALEQRVAELEFPPS